jgi:hypothetical protein
MTWEQMSMFTDKELGIELVDSDYRIIGLTGYAQSGKDTLASVLVDRYGYRRIAFADTIRSFLYEVNPMVACSPTGYLKDLVNLVGWDKAKQEPQVRRILQDLGMAARNAFGQDFWVKHALKPYLANHPVVGAGNKLVITDVRFINEAETIQALGGQIWRVKRIGVAAVNSHVSEHEMDGYEVDQIFINNGTIEDLEVLVQTRMRNAISK